MFCSGIAGAATQAPDSQLETQEDCIARLETLRADRAANPLESVNALEPLIELSQKNNWQKAYAYASTYKIELYVKQEDISGAHALYEEIRPRAEALSLQTLITRLMMANLKIKFALSDIQNIRALHGPLMERAEASDNPSEKGEIYLAVGLSEQGNLRLAEATRSYKLAYDYFEIAGDTVSKALVLNSLADTYNTLGDMAHAVEYFKLALDLHDSAGDEFGKSVVFYNLGRVYLKTEEFELAQTAFTGALEISEAIADQIGVAWAQSALAKLALKTQQWEVALNLLERAETVFEAVGDRQSQFGSLLNQVHAHMGAKNIKDAERKLAQSKPLLPPVLASGGYFTFNQAEEKVALATNNYRRAYSSRKKNYDWLVGQHEQDKEKQIQRYKTEFDTQLKDKQNEVLLKENELKALKISEQQREQKFWILAITLASVLLLSAAALLVIQTRNRNRFKTLALRDHLTDSPNRRAILQFAQERFADAARSDIPLIVGIVDLDSFKKLNDSFGHDAGDEVLKNFALACSTALRKQDGFGRYGGEEWLIVFNHADLSEVPAIFNRLRSQLNELPAQGVPPDHTVTFSMGIAQYSAAEDKNLDALIKRADEKLYLAKDSGRDRFEA